MRKLHGIVYEDSPRDLNFKQKYLLFDKFYVIDLHQLLEQSSSTPAYILADLEFLEEQKIIEDKPLGLLTQLSQASDFIWDEVYSEPPTSSDDIAIGAESIAWDALVHNGIGTVRRELTANGIYSAPIYKQYMQETMGFPYQPGGSEITNKSELVLDLAMARFPLPDHTCSWEDLIAFREEAHEKLWGIRRFLNTLATKNQSEAEIRDDIEWSMNEYEKAMKLHRIKASRSFVEVFVISPLEIIENLVKLNFSTIARGILSVQKRKIELMEAEMKAPGRECAYIFAAKERFGNSPKV
jgi:hypothetical protein